MALKLKRVYEPPAPDDGFRILVDRLWPRGLARKSARVDLWLKDIAPSRALRQWFAHDPKRWRPFRARYFRELDANPDAVATLRDHASRGTVTLLYAARDERYNDAVALQAYVRGFKPRP